MIILLAVLCTLILISLGVITVFSILLYNRISNLLIVNGAYQAQEYRDAVAIQKAKKPSAVAVKEEKRGRELVNTDDLVDITEVDFETAYKAIEEIGNGAQG